MAEKSVFILKLNSKGLKIKPFVLENIPVVKLKFKKRKRK